MSAGGRFHAGQCVEEGGGPDIRVFPPRTHRGAAKWARHRPQRPPQLDSGGLNGGESESWVPQPHSALQATVCSCLAPSAVANAENRHSPHKRRPTLEHSICHRGSHTSTQASCFRARAVPLRPGAGCSKPASLGRRQHEGIAVSGAYALQNPSQRCLLQREGRRALAGISGQPDCATNELMHHKGAPGCPAGLYECWRSVSCRAVR